MKMPSLRVWAGAAAAAVAVLASGVLGNDEYIAVGAAHRESCVDGDGSGDDCSFTAGDPASCGAGCDYALPVVFRECGGLWLDTDSPQVITDPAAPWGTHNHFDGHHSFTGPAGPEDFEACMLQCFDRANGLAPADGCRMFHYIDHPPWFPCGVPSAGLPGTMVPAPGALAPETVAIYVLGFCDCVGCCSGISPPANGHMGSCDPAGRLEHGATCELMCNPGFQLTAGLADVTCALPGRMLPSAGTTVMTCTPCAADSFAAGDGRPCGDCTPPRQVTGSVPEVESLLSFAADYNCTAVVAEHTVWLSPDTVDEHGCDYPIFIDDQRLPLGTLLAELCPFECGCVGLRHDGPLCLPRQYTAAVCAVNADTELRSCALPCAPGSGEVQHCVPGAPRVLGTDRTCEDCNATGASYHSVNSTWSPGGEDEVCRPCTVCQPGEAEIRPCNASTDTVCETCPAGRYNTDGRVCHDCTVCPPAEGETTHCTPSTNSVCEPCVATLAHDTGNWSAGGFLGTVCAPCTLCPAGEHVTVNCTITTDTVCGPCAYNHPRYEPFYSDLGSLECSECSERCPEGTNEDAPCRYEGNRQCSQCEAGHFAAGSSVRNVYTEVATEVLIARDYVCVGNNASLDPLSPNASECFGWERSNGTEVETNTTVTTRTRVAAEYLIQQPEESNCSVLAPAGSLAECGGICVPRNQLIHGCGTHTQAIDHSAVASVRSGLHVRPYRWTSIVDLSTGQPTRASSSAYEMSPSFAVDGVWGREHFNQGRHHSQAGTNEWWSVHLAALTVDPQVVVYARSCCTEQFHHTLRVYIGRTEDFAAASHCITWDAVVDRSKQIAVCIGLGEHLFIAADGYLQLPEVEVSGVALRDRRMNTDINITDSYSDDAGLPIVTYENHTEVVRTETTELLAASQCRPWTQCSPLYEYESVAPTSISDRVCEINSCEPSCDANALCTLTACAFEVGGVQLACSHCNVTAHGRVIVSTANCSSDDAAFAALEDVVSAQLADATLQRTCICNPGFFGNGLQCLAHTSCLEGSTYEVSAPTELFDRTCVPVSRCGQFQFEAAAPTLVSDRECGNCSAGTYQPFLSRASCPACAAGKYDHDANPTTACQVCPEGYTVTHDRLACQGTALVGILFEVDVSALATSTEQFGLDVVDDIAAALGVPTGRFRVLSVVSGSIIVNLEITPAVSSLDPSPFDLLSALQNTSAAFTAAGFAIGGFDVFDDPCMDQPCDANADCLRTGGLGFACECRPGLWGDGFNCIEWSECALNRTYEVVVPTSTYDRQCVDVTECRPGFVEQAGPSYSTDRVCVQCPAGTEKIRAGQYTQTHLAMNITVTEDANATFNVTSAGVPCLSTVRQIDSTTLAAIDFVKFTYHDGTFQQWGDNTSFATRTPAAALNPPIEIPCDRAIVQVVWVNFNLTWGWMGRELHFTLADENGATRETHEIRAGYSHNCSEDAFAQGSMNGCKDPVAFAPPGGNLITGRTSSHVITGLSWFGAGTNLDLVGVVSETAPYLHRRVVINHPYLRRTACEDCPSGRYDHDGHAATGCAVCPVGYSVGSNRDNCTLEDPCTAGEHSCADQANCTMTGRAQHACSCTNNTWGSGQWCHPVSECIVGVAYETATPTARSDRFCTAVTRCLLNEFELEPPTNTQDRNCSLCAPGNEANGLVCEPCVGSTYDHDGDSSTPCVECRHGSPVEDRLSCEQGACSVEEDDCAPQATCIANMTAKLLGLEGHICECSYGFWGSGQWCVPWTQCTEGLSYETRSPTYVSNRECSSAAVCGYREYELIPPTVLADRTCAVCPAGHEKVMNEVALLRFIVPIWEDVLGVPVPLEYDSDFVRLGGSDFDAIQMLYFLARDLSIGVTLSTHVFLSAPTVQTVITLVVQQSEHRRGRVVCDRCLERHYDHDDDPNSACLACPAGWVTDLAQTVCELDDPCVAELHDCAAQAVCTRTGRGRHDCECDVGFFGDGRGCFPWTECVVGTSFEQEAPTSTSDRVCAKVTECPTGHRQVSPPACVPTTNPLCSVAVCAEHTWPIGSRDESAVCVSGEHLDGNWGGCISNVTFQDALRTCLDIGARLCTPLEMSNALSPQGCSIGQQFWTATTAECDDGFAPVLDHTGASVVRNCTAKRDFAAVRCCADTAASSENCTDYAVVNSSLSSCDYPSQVMDRVCVPCPPGTYSARSSTHCVECAPGKYDHDQVPASHCVDCPRGFVVGAGRTSCTMDDACLAGTHDCAPNAACARTGHGTWECTCKPGHWGDGRCVDEDGRILTGLTDPLSGVRYPHDRVSCETRMIETNYTWVQPVQGGCCYKDTCCYGDTCCSGDELGPNRDCWPLDRNSSAGAARRRGQALDSDGNEIAFFETDEEYVQTIRGADRTLVSFLRGINDTGTCLNTTVLAGYAWRPERNVTSLWLPNVTNGTTTWYPVELPWDFNVSTLPAENLTQALAPAACVEFEGGTLDEFHAAPVVNATLPDRWSCVNATRNAGFSWHEPVQGGCSDNGTLLPLYQDRSSCVDYSYSANYAWHPKGSWCEPWEVCVLGVSFEASYPNSTSNRICALASECLAGQYEVEPPGNKTDRVCSDCGPGNFAAPRSLRCEECRAVGILYADHDLDASTPCRVRNDVVYGAILVTLSVIVISMAVGPLYKRPENRVWLRQTLKLCCLGFKRCRRKTKLRVIGLLRRYGLCRKCVARVTPEGYKVDDDDGKSEYSYYSYSEEEEEEEEEPQVSLALHTMAAAKLLHKARRVRESPPITPPIILDGSKEDGPPAILDGGKEEEEEGADGDMSAVPGAVESTDDGEPPATGGGTADEQRAP